MPDEKLIPESMVKLLFEQVKDTADKNTQAVREFTIVIRELSQIIGQQASRTEVMQALKEHDAGCEKRGNDVYDVIEKEDSELGKQITCATTKIEDAAKTIENNHQLLTDIKNTVLSIDSSIKELSGKVKIMIAVVLIAFSLAVITFMFVKSASETNINSIVKNAVVEATREIITSRPNNQYPLPPHEHDSKGNTIYLDEKGKLLK